MSAAVAHRGTEAVGAWIAGPVALGHRASHTTVESARESQPLVHAAAGLTLVADGRIDNRADLIQLLKIRAGEEVGDGELMLHAYARWGRECPSRLIGDFAFAIWDARAQSMFIARDPMGVRPLYFFLSDRLLALGSEIKALFRCPGVPERIDDEQMALHIASCHDDRMATLYAGISRLPAGQSMVVSRSASSRSTYWKPEPRGELQYSTGEQYVQAFREHFDVAVHARLRSSVPVGATLSGGLDSSSIVCTARQAHESGSGPALHTFSLVFPGLSGNDLRLIDERSYIDSVVRRGGLIPHYVRGDLIGPLDDRERVLWHLDEPSFAPNLYLHWGIYAAARRAGVRVLLDGFDGDSTVSHGFGRLTGLMRSGQWAVFESEIRAFSGHSGRRPENVLEHFGLPYLAHLARSGRLLEWIGVSRELARRFELSPSTLALRHGVLPAAPDALRRAWRSWRMRHANETHCLRSPFAEQVARFNESAERKATLDGVPTEQQMHADGLSQPLYQLALETADKSARAFGIEPRYPFFDRRLIDFCLAVPEDRKFAEGWSRALFRRSMEGRLPSDIQWRSTKGNLAPNFDRQMRAADLPALDGRSATPDLERLVDSAALRRVARRYKAAPADRWGDPDGQLLFRMTMVGDWLSGSWKGGGPVVPARPEAGHLHNDQVAPASAGVSAGSRREPIECPA